MTETSSHLALGLDLGGSSIKTAVLRVGVEEKPLILATSVQKIDQSREPSLVLDTLALAAAELRTQHGEFGSVGVGIPGIFDEDTGRSTLLPNFPASWKGFPFRTELEAVLGQRLKLVNDAKAFSVAESVLGAGSSLNNLVCVVLGTGVGGGVVLGGKIWAGSGSAGELGHLTVELDGPQCGCGNRGCVEAFASTAAIISAGGQKSVQEVFEAAATGDTRAQAAIDRAINALGAGLANAFITLAPDAFIIGGGIAEAGTQLTGPLHDEIRRRIKVAPPERIKVLPATLGRYAGAIGAAIMSTHPESRVP